jgi:Protein of unknown function (DUF3108)
VIIDDSWGICNNAGHSDHPALRLHQVRLRFSFVLILILAIAGLALGSPLVDPMPAGIETPGYVPGPLPFHPGQELTYRVIWEELPVAFAHISLRRDPAHSQEWLGEASVATNKLVDVFYRMRALLREEFPPQTMASDVVFIHQTENGRKADYVVTFDRAKAIVETTKRKHDHTEVKRFLATHPLGPIGASLLAISQPIKVGGSMTLDVFAATERYVVQFHVVRREKIDMDGEEIEAFRINPTLLYVSNPKNHYKVTQAVLWVSTDRRHVPLRIEADTFVGRIYIDLMQEPKVEKKEKIETRKEEDISNGLATK